MSCPGLHCPGCTGGQSLGVLAGVVVLAALADETVRWVADRIWWIGGTLAVVLVLSVAASMWLESMTERRAARFAAAHGIYSRADVILPEPVRYVRAVVVPPAAPAVAPAVPPQAGPAAIHLHFHGLPGAAQAAVIRQALNGRTDQP